MNQISSTFLLLEVVKETNSNSETRIWGRDSSNRPQTIGNSSGETRRKIGRKRAVKVLRESLSE